MKRVALARLCSYSVACGLWASASLGATGTVDRHPQCVAADQPAAGAQRSPATAAALDAGDAHVASLVAAHELMRIELGGGGLDPMPLAARAAVATPRTKRPSASPNPMFD